MSVQMFDTAGNVSVLPSGHTYAGYVNGRYQTYLPLRRQFPGASVLSISVTASALAHCLDIETGDASPGEAPGWVRAAHGAGIHRPVLYANGSTMVPLKSMLYAAGLRRGVDYLLWLADPDNDPRVADGYDAKQYGWHTLYDVSTVLDPAAFFAERPDPPPPPPPQPEELDVATEIAINNENGRVELWIINAKGRPSHRWMQQDGSWSSWTEMTCPAKVTELTSARHPDGHLEVFARGTDGATYHCWQKGPNGVWSDFFHF